MGQTKSADSKSEIYNGLLNLADKGQVKRCRFLYLQKHELYYSGACEKDYADFVAATDVSPVPSWGSYHVPYTWPVCPKDCPMFEASPDLADQLKLDQYEKEAKASQLAKTMEQKQIPLVKPNKEQVTLKWLGENVSLGFWLKAATAFLASFLLGVYSGQPIQNVIGAAVAAIASVKKSLGM